MQTPFIPQRTKDELAASHGEGTRHAAIIKIAMSLLGNGLPPQAVFATIRPQFDSDKSDKEIQDVIEWCQAKNPTPSTPRNGSTMPVGAFSPRLAYVQTSQAAKAPPEPETPAPALAALFVDGDTVTELDTMTSSPVELGDFSTHGEVFRSALYRPEDRLNIVCSFSLNEKGKANPSGGGKTMTRDEWLDWFKKSGVPKSKAGAWLRPNTCNDGSGKDGAICDSDVSRFDFVLIESDCLSFETQLSVLAKLKLPIAAILTSGGKSVHAWAKVGAKDKADYDAKAGRILTALKPIGFDPANKNASRLSRLPGSVRTIGAHESGNQSLLYLNPDAKPLTEEGLTELEAQVRPPFVSKFPMLATSRNAIDRYDELLTNRGKTGLATGLPTFDRKTGGLKKGNFIVLAAETNAGKSALALNIINQALKDSKPCALFSLEMDRDEIFDLLICMNTGLSRNKFNTGEFDNADMVKISHGAEQISRRPLHIFDDPCMTVDEIEAHCVKLVAAGGLSLVVVDYLQLISPPMLSRESREQQIAAIGRSLRSIAKKCKVPLIAVSQLNEEGKIRESRSVAHDAHIVFILEWQEANLKLRITKGRSIPKATYDMHFAGEFCRMGEQSRIQDDE